MNVLNKNDEDDGFIKSTDNENEDIIIMIKSFFLSITSNILLLLSLIGFSYTQ